MLASVHPWPHSPGQPEPGWKFSGCVEEMIMVGPWTSGEHVCIQYHTENEYRRLARQLCQVVETRSGYCGATVRLQISPRMP
jgi:hypothetical protein